MRRETGGLEFPRQFELLGLLLTPEVLEEVRIDVASNVGGGISPRFRTNWRGRARRRDRRARRWVAPEAALFEDFVSPRPDVPRDDLYRAAAVGTGQRIDVIDTLDQGSPSAAGLGGRGLGREARRADRDPSGTWRRRGLGHAQCGVLCRKLERAPHPQIRIPSGSAQPCLFFTPSHPPAG